MPEQADQYFADHASSASEVERLGRICKMYDAWTQQQIFRAGVIAGDTVAEIGFGTGSMLLWLSSQVGDEGAAHGYDLTSRFVDTDLAILPRNNVEVFELNIQDTELPKKQYDFVYTRLLLSHLYDPKTAMKNMLAGLKPGGTMITLDYDSLVVRAEEDTEEAYEFNQAVQEMNLKIGSQGLVSASYGAEMAQHMREIDMLNISDTILQRHYKGGDFEALVAADGLDLLAQVHPETANQAQLIAEKMRTPGFAYRDSDIHCCIAAKRED